MKQSTAFQLQAFYYFITGIWPLIDITSFMEVTGPKTDVWLVKMVGLLTSAIAVSLFLHRHSEGTVLRTLAVSAALSYLAIDVYYVSAGIISKIYLADAAAEITIILLVLLSKTHTRDTSPAGV